jgi:hypothetical protein
MVAEIGLGFVADPETDGQIRPQPPVIIEEDPGV